MNQKIERKLGRYAIRGLMKYVIALYILGYIINLMSPGFYQNFLSFDVSKVLHGEVWRLVTFLIQPIDSSNLLFMLISVYLYYMIGNSLEMKWGSFWFNVFYFSGVLCSLLSSVIIYVGTSAIAGKGVTYSPTLEFINLSMFLAFAVEFSEVKLLLFFVIPIKIKYLGIIYGAIYVYDIVRMITSGDPLGICMAVAFFVAMLNFVVFYLSTKKLRRMSPSNIKRRTAYKKSVRTGENAGPVSSMNGRQVITRHKCAVCGRTELDDENLEFRFCSKCEGNYEYCMDHLYTHTHVVREKKDNARPEVGYDEKEIR